MRSPLCEGIESAGCGKDCLAPCSPPMRAMLGLSQQLRYRAAGVAADHFIGADVNPGNPLNSFFRLAANNPNVSRRMAARAVSGNAGCAGRVGRRLPGWIIDMLFARKICGLAAVYSRPASPATSRFKDCQCRAYLQHSRRQLTSPYTGQRWNNLSASGKSGCSGRRVHPG